MVFIISFIQVSHHLTSKNQVRGSLNTFNHTSEIHFTVESSFVGSIVLTTENEIISSLLDVCVCAMIVYL